MIVIICIILLVLLVILLELVLLPIHIRIDTGREVFFHLSVGGIFTCCCEASAEGWWMSFRFLFFRKSINLAEIKQTSTRKKQNAKVKKGASYNPSPLRLLKAFRLQKLEWKLDTGDFLQNAHLYPLFQLLSREPVALSVNFNGQNSIVLHASTRLFHLGIALLKV